MKKSIKILIIFFIFVIFYQRSFAENVISIVYKVNKEIITSKDIQNEENYLLALSKQLKNLNKKKRLEIAKTSILRETIKKIEIKKYYVLNQKDPLLDKIIEDFMTKLGLNNKTEFEEYLSNYEISLTDIKKKIEIETLWNQLIYKKYQRQVNIDKNKLIEKIKNKKDIKTLILLSELVFKLEIDEKLDEKINKINESINEIGFQNSATIYSISNSSKFGGDIGWVEKQNLSKKIQNYIANIKIGSYTKPIPITNGYLILKLEDTKNEVVKIDENKELQKMIKYETDNQLNTFSKIYFDKIKINSNIDEL
jgi:peptidyl-prolyl cis-trans isomerase SurA